jgi:hypothetical protein
MDHWPEILSALTAGQHAADQALGSTQACLAVVSSCRNLVMSGRVVFSPELQADRKGVPQATYHLSGPLQIEKAPRHVRVGVGLMGLALIGFQDSDFGLFPVSCFGSDRSDRICNRPLSIDTIATLGQERIGSATVSLAMRGSRLCDLAAPSR